MSTILETSSASFDPEDLRTQLDESISTAATTDHLVQNLKNLFSLFDGFEYDHDLVCAAFEKVFDKELRVLTYTSNSSIEDLLDTDKRVELDYYAFYNQVIVAYAEKRVIIEDFYIEQRPKGIINYSFQMDQMGHKATLHISAHTRNGKIVYGERKGTSFASVENLKNLFRYYDGSEPYDHNQSYSAFENAFDKNVTALTYLAGTDVTNLGDPAGRVTLTFDDIFDNISRWVEKCWVPMELAYIKPVSGGNIEYSVRGSYMGRTIATSSFASTVNGKITRVETKMFEIEKS